MKNLFPKIPRMTRRTAIIATVAIVASISLVSASLLANYIIQTNSYRVTASAGLTVFEADGVTQITAITWGDIQQPSSTTPGVMQTHQVVLKDTGGSSFTLYVIDKTTHSTVNGGPVSTVSTLNPSGLGTGVTLVWNFDQLTTGGGLPLTCVVSGVTYTPCMALSAGTSTPIITLTLSADNTSTPSTAFQNFILEFDGFSTPLG